MCLLLDAISNRDANTHNFTVSGINIITDFLVKCIRNTVDRNTHNNVMQDQTRYNFIFALISSENKTLKIVSVRVKMN